MAKIYVSSTFLDLEEYRKQASLAIRRTGHEDVAMEYYVAEDRRPIDRCLEDVSACDLYVGIFAWRWGWIPQRNNRKKLSITELEYRRAVSMGKTCLIFCLDGRVPWPPDFVDADRTRIQRLRTEVAEKHGADVFRSPEQLGHAISDAIHNWEKHFAAHRSLDLTRHPSHEYFLEEPARSPRFDRSTVDAFRQLLRPDRRREFPLNMAPESFLERAGVRVDNSLTLTGALLFRLEPTKELLTAYVHCAAYGSEEQENKPLTDEIHGTVHTQITGTLDFVRRHTRSLDYFAEDAGRTVRLDQYPMICLREVVANAICHRDYQDFHRSVNLRIFSNRLEVLSPGEWLGAKQLQGKACLGDMRSESIARNPVLARLLSWIKFVERQGSGIGRAIADCNAKEALSPTVEERDGYVVVTIFPSRQFEKAEKGYSMHDAEATKPEVAAAVEEEQLAFVRSRASETEKLAALQQYRSRNARSASRLLRDLPELRPEDVVAYLQNPTGWNGDDLKSYVSNWLYGGSSKADVANRLMNFARDSQDPKRLSYVYYALLENEIPVSREDYFDMCWCAKPPRIEYQAIRVPIDGNSVRFVMGSEGPTTPANEQPAHEVELSPYRIGVAPVTREEFTVFSGGGRYTDNLPVIGVTWWEAWVFCQWLGGELPTEAQWECACRAGTRAKWSFGDDPKKALALSWVDEGDDGDPHPVRQKPPNPWGLYDMHGNVGEWCLDRYALYVPGTHRDPVGPQSGTTRVLRGGNAAAPTECSRSARRDHASPDSTSLVTGFRVAFKDAASSS